MFSKEKKQLKCRTIIELMGRPPEFLVETINKTIETLEKEDGIKISKKEIFEPREMENEKNIFSTFVELEIIIDNMEKLFEFIVNYMPSNVEIIEPSEINFQVNEANAVINGIISRIHKLDAVTKKVGFENMILKNQIEQLLNRSIKIEAVDNSRENKAEKKEESESKSSEEKTEKKKEKKSKK